MSKSKVNVRATEVATESIVMPVTEIIFGRQDVDYDTDEIQHAEPAEAKPKAKAKEYYIDKKVLLAEVLACKESNVLSPKLVKMFVLIATHSNERLRYRDPMDKEDCISSALMDLCKYWDRFNPEKSDNAFAFYTQISKHAFAKAWKKLHPEEFSGTLSLSQGVYNF